MPMTETRYITVGEMRDKLSISKNKAYQIANSGSLDTVRIGRALRINEESLASWLEALTSPKRTGRQEMS